MNLTGVKKFLTAGAFIVSVMTTGYLFAAKLRCGKITVTFEEFNYKKRVKAGGDDDIFPFSVTQKCRVEGFSSNTNFKSLRKAYAKAVQAEKEFSVNDRDIKDNQMYKKNAAVSLSGKHERKCHGKIKMNVEMFFYVDKEGNFNTFYETKKIKAKGDAKATNKIFDTSSLSNSGGQFVMTLKRDVDVEKRGMAKIMSDSNFVKTVAKHLDDDFENFTKLHEDLLNRALRNL